MTTKYLIVCTYRSGSMLLGELLQEATGITHYGEYIHHGMNGIPLLQLAQSKLSYDLNQFENERTKRIEELKTAQQWIVRNPITAFLSNRELIDWCIDREDTKIIFLYRRSLEDQFLSQINMTYRNILNKRFINHFTEDTKFIAHNQMSFDYNLKDSLFYTIGNATTWRLLYDLYKDNSVLVCYEDHIKTNRLHHVGIGDDTIAKYFSKQNHYIPTPFVATKLKNDNIENYLNFLKRYKHLTDF